MQVVTRDVCAIVVAQHVGKSTRTVEFTLAHNYLVAVGEHKYKPRVTVESIAPDGAERVVRVLGDFIHPRE
jgi:hypothetical protein